MTRQLQSKYAPIKGNTRRAEISQGGTGSGTLSEAVVQLGLTPLSLVGVPGGLAEVDPITGKLPIDSVGVSYNNLPAPGLSIEGPLQLIHGAKSIYSLTEFKNNIGYVVSIDSGSVSLSGDKITIIAPATGRSVVLTINERPVTIPIGVFKPLKASILTPSANSSAPKSFQITVEKYQAEPLTYTDWVELSAASGTITPPVNVSSVEFEGRGGASGEATMVVKGREYSLGVATVRRSVRLDTDSSVSYRLAEDGTLKYRFIVPSSLHVSTDWEIALDAAFTQIVVSSYNDTVNLQKLDVNILPGSYYARVRYKGQFTL
jgi:hypothetical protein